MGIQCLWCHGESYRTTRGAGQRNVKENFSHKLYSGRSRRYPYNSGSLVYNASGSRIASMMDSALANPALADSSFHLIQTLKDSRDGSSKASNFATT